MADNSKLFTEFEPSTRAEWIKSTQQSLKGKPFDKLIKTTYEGFDIQPIYMADDIEGICHTHTLPGEYPYVRGTHTDGYLSHPWHIAQHINLTDPKLFNDALKHDLAHGQTAIYISQHTVHLNNIEDAEVLFDGIDLTQYPIFIEADVHATGIYNVLTAYLHNDHAIQLQGCIGYDPLHHLASTGTVSREIFQRMSALQTLAYGMSPDLDTIAVRTAIYHDAGANAVQEMAIAMATGVTYIRELMAHQHHINSIARNMRFYLTVGENFFMEIAKLRAIKMMWAQIVREFGGNDEAAKIKLHIRTGSRNKTRHDPYVNMLRVTTEAMAGAIGGVDSMSTAPFDMPFGESDEFSRRIARNVQLILQEEVNLVDVIDPAGGSWYVEHLTDQLAQSAWDLFQQIESNGGMIASLESGFIQSEIETSVNSRNKHLALRRDVLVGTNMYPNLGEKLPEDRNPLQNGASDLTDSNDKFEIIKVEPLQAMRLSQPFEKLRANAVRYQQENGNRPQIFLANFGELSDYKARMDFTRGFYEVGGFELIDHGGYEGVADALKAAIESKAPAVVICSTDDKYAEVVPEFTKTLKAQKPEMVVILAGYPQGKVDEYKQAGVDDFIHIRANCYEMNTDLQDRLGVGK